jgi:2-polyprenyl-3-methyl-5-hydroxy-6-metoxy-1,4-benzoquinol methylase
MTNSSQKAKSAYVLGQSEAEYQRLMMQARFLRPYTEKYLRSAGVGQAMSVLDVGAGVGDVSLLAGELVGSGGNVLGIDFDGQALEGARARAAELRCSDWVEFEETALDDFSTDRKFDALIGRFVLLYLKDPAATIRRLLQFVKPGGIVVFHEIDFTNRNASDPACPLFDDAYALISEVFRRAGFAPDYGRRVGKAFVDAGLPFPTICADVTAGGGKGSFLYPWVAYTLATVGPRLEQLGLPNPDFPLDASLVPMLEEAIVAASSQIMGPTLVGAWARKPI